MLPGVGSEKESKLSFSLALLLQFNTIYAKIGIIVNSFPCFALNPLFFVRSGYVYVVPGVIDAPGNTGTYWSSTSVTNKLDVAVRLNLNELLNPSNTTGTRRTGRPLRCLAI